MAEIERDRPFYDESRGGATFSGGEPLQQAAFLLELLQACRANGIHTALDTCGYASWAVVERVLPYVDLFLYDVKTLDDRKHRMLTGVSNELILSNLRAIDARGATIVLRAPVIPGANDSPDEMRSIGALAATLHSVVRVELLPYHRIGVEKYGRMAREYSLPEVQPPSQDRITALAQIVQHESGLLVEAG
jgi:pyruvate formate lyase activating enzyme